jgi:hypothetical protein
MNSSRGVGRQLLGAAAVLIEGGEKLAAAG